MGTGMSEPLVGLGWSPRRPACLCTLFGGEVGAGRLLTKSSEAEDEHKLMRHAHANEPMDDEYHAHTNQPMEQEERQDGIPHAQQPLPVQ